MLNLVELKRWRDYLANVPDELVELEYYRKGQKKSPICDSVGCVVGHCTGLYQENELPRDRYGLIDFNLFSFNLLGVVSTSENVWKFLFDSEWGYNYNPETWGTQKSFALHRMDYVLKHGDAPDYWNYNMTPADFII